MSDHAHLTFSHTSIKLPEPQGPLAGPVIIMDAEGRVKEVVEVEVWEARRTAPRTPCDRHGLINCPGCITVLPRRAATCARCGTVLKRGLVCPNEDRHPPKRGPGRPRKEPAGAVA